MPVCPDRTSRRSTGARCWGGFGAGAWGATSASDTRSVYFLSADVRRPFWRRRFLDLDCPFLLTREERFRYHWLLVRDDLVPSREIYYDPPLSTVSRIIVVIVEFSWMEIHLERFADCCMSTHHWMVLNTIVGQRLNVYSSYNYQSHKTLL